MQHGFTNDDLAFAQLRGGSETLGVDRGYHPQANLQAIFKNQASCRYGVPKHLPQSPASTVSDRSDHSDSSSISENSSQTDPSELGDSPSTNDHLEKQHHYGIGTKHGNNCNIQSVTSSLATEIQPNDLDEFGRNKHVVGSARYDGMNNNTSHSNSNNNNNSINSVTGKCGNRFPNSHDSHACQAPNVKTIFAQSRQTSRSCIQDCSRNEQSQLAYRSRPENTFESLEASNCIDATLEGVALRPMQERSSSPKVELPNVEKSTQAQASRCYRGLLNPFSGLTSSRSTPTDSPQHVQTNARRRPMNSALPPPKLRRDTDNTDAIVRMIVIFCTNLIQSIWPVDSMSGSSTCPTATQQGGNVLPLQVFITETLRRSKTSYSTLQIALFYLILLKQCLPELANPGQSGQSGCRAMLCGRRMFLTALILASKYLQDRNYSARAWSKISGLPMKEINDNERRYLRFVGWDLHVPKDAFENWSKIVLAICRLSTGQDFTGQDSHQQPPPPAPGMASISCATRKGQLQDMCPDNQMYAVRAWWVFNLKALRTDVVRCPRKTEQYVLSIPQLKGAPTLTRPLFENKCSEDAQSNAPEQEVLPSVHKLSRPPSMDFLERVQPQVVTSHVLEASKTMPPPPPVLGTLPTPQTTPRSDMTSTWRTSPTRSTSRCRDSASLLRGLDRACPMANLEKFSVPRSSSRPPPFLHNGTLSQECKSSLSQPSPGAWLSQPYRAKDFFQTPDTSLTSSPESIVSDLSSMSGFVGRSRTSSFSSTSSRSTMPQLSTMVSDLERCEGFKRQLNSLDAQIAPRVRDWRNSSMEKGSSPYTPQNISRPQTAFRTSILRPGCVEDLTKFNNADSELVLDEGYWSSDHAQEKREERRRQSAANALLNMQLRLEGDLTPTALKNIENLKLRLPRPSMMRSNTQVFAPVKPSSLSTQQTLKRSRSESFDFGAEPCLPESSACNVSHAQARNVQQSCQPWADSKQPVFSGTQDMNKRIAVQSAAATRASVDLRKEACARFDLHNFVPEHTKRSQATDSFTNEPSWQQCAPRLREVHL